MKIIRHLLLLAALTLAVLPAFAAPAVTNAVNDVLHPEHELAEEELTWWQRLTLNPAEMDWRDTALAVGGTVATVVLGWWLADNVDVGDSNGGPDELTPDKIAAAEQAAEQRTLEYGPSAPVRYNISGTFSGPVVPGFTGEWVPSITFGAQSSSRGGAIAAFTLPPRAVGEAAQVVEGLGAWSTTAEGEILIEGAASYDGRAGLTGAPAPGTAASFSVTLRTKSGLTLTGGSVLAIEVSP